MGSTTGEKTAADIGALPKLVSGIHNVRICRDGCDRADVSAS
jgi:hypothetical protein